MTWRTGLLVATGHALKLLYSTPCSRAASSWEATRNWAREMEQPAMNVRLLATCVFLTIFLLVAAFLVHNVRHIMNECLTLINDEASKCTCATPAEQQLSIWRIPSTSEIERSLTKKPVALGAYALHAWLSFVCIVSNNRSQNWITVMASLHSKLITQAPFFHALLHISSTCMKPHDLFL